jgi:leader peptidase (prepilin peptidase) / N-methyltransferase
MLQSWLELALPLRILLLFVAGCVAGHAVNWAAMSWRIKPLAGHPWNGGGQEGNSWWRFLPVFGWFSSRSGGNTSRALLVEVLVGVLWALIYWWVVLERGTLPDPFAAMHLQDEPLALNARANPLFANWWLAMRGLHYNALTLMLLVLPMIAATIIDWDEQIIPDEITVPGTLLGLIGMTICPLSALPWVKNMLIQPPPLTYAAVDLASPLPWPMVLNGAPQIESLVIGLACYTIWCGGLLPRVWYGHLGTRRAARYFWAIMLRERSYVWIAPLWALGTVGIIAVWWFGATAWQSLLSSLVGMFVGGAIIWAVRIIGRWALGKEAMGFGDVTLMSMIGAVTGWQAILPIFFIAPVAGIVLGMGRWILHQDRMLPYGPFLCLSTWIVWFAWAPIWTYMEPLLELTWLLPGMLGACFLLLGLMLLLLRVLKRG